MNHDTDITDLNLTETDLAMTAAIRVIGDVGRERDELRADLRYALDKIEQFEPISHTTAPHGWRSPSMSEPTHHIATAVAADDIVAERHRQDDLKLAGRFAYTCADPELTHAERLTVLGEEFGEVCHEVNEAIGGHAKLRRDKLRKELVQVAAVAVAWIEAIDAERMTGDGHGQHAKEDE